LKNVIITFKKSFKIKEGDIIKFGKVHMTVRELYIKNTNSVKKVRTFIENKQEFSKQDNTPNAGENTNNSFNQQNKYYFF
jgi:hypothetical protein